MSGRCVACCGHMTHTGCKFTCVPLISLLHLPGAECCGALGEGTWGRAGGGQLVLAPEAFVEVQGQWDPGSWMGKGYSPGCTWHPGQALSGEGNVRSPLLGLNFGFPCGRSFLTTLQLRKCIVEMRDMVPFHPSPLPVRSRSLPAGGLP